MVFGLIGGFLFILIQLILIVDFAHGVAEFLHRKTQETQKKSWLAGQRKLETASVPWFLVISLFCSYGRPDRLFVSGGVNGCCSNVRLLREGQFFYVESIFLLPFMAFAPLQDGCDRNKAFLSVIILLSVAVSVASILPWVQDRLPKSGLLQSSFITLYVVYLTWSAFLNNPGKSFFMPVHNL